MSIYPTAIPAQTMLPSNFAMLPMRNGEKHESRQEIRMKTIVTDCEMEAGKKRRDFLNAGGVLSSFV